MTIPNRYLLDNATTTGEHPAIPVERPCTVQLTGWMGTGTGTATVTVRGSNDALEWIPLLTLSLDLTTTVATLTPTADGELYIAVPYRQLSAVVDTLSAGGHLTCTIAGD